MYSAQARSQCRTELRCQRSSGAHAVQHAFKAGCETVQIGETVDERLHLVVGGILQGREGAVKFGFQRVHLIEFLNEQVFQSLHVCSMSTPLAKAAGFNF